MPQFDLFLQKKLDFTLKVCGDISTIPGVLDALKVRDLLSFGFYLTGHTIYIPVFESA